MLYHWEVRRRGKRKTQKSKREEKVVGFTSASIFLVRKREAVTHGGTRRADHLTRRRTQETSIVKGWEDKRNRGCLLDTFM